MTKSYGSGNTTRLAHDRAEPSDRETALLRRLHDEQLAVFEKDAKAAAAFLSVGESRPAKGLAKPRVAAAGVAYFAAPPTAPP